MGCSVGELMKNSEKRRLIRPENYISGDAGLPTLTDILAELERPGRDPRLTFEAFSFAEGVEKIGDLSPGMTLPGVVTNVTSFGAFVDIGVHQDGLVHRKHLPGSGNHGLVPGKRVEVTVLEVDLPRNRISLSMKEKGGAGKNVRS